MSILVPTFAHKISRTLRAAAGLIGYAILCVCFGPPQEAAIAACDLLKLLRPAPGPDDAVGVKVEVPNNANPEALNTNPSPEPADGGPSWHRRTAAVHFVLLLRILAAVRANQEAVIQLAPVVAHVVERLLALVMP